MSINELFENGTNAESTNTRTLSGTAALTSISNAAATEAIRKMEADIENYRDRIAASAKDNAELDKLLDELAPGVDIAEDDPLRFLDDETVEGMLKSQQSKRSRSKSKAMTLDNYRNLLSAAIAENILRDLYDKPKQASGVKHRGTVDFTPDQLEALAEDQVALRKEIRNIQSKKSIMKSKEGFDEGSEAWQQLLKAEAMLKDLRVGGRSGSHIIEVDTTKDKLAELLGDIDLEHLKAHDSKELLARISELAQQ